MIRLRAVETFVVSAVSQSPARSVLGDLVTRTSLIARVTDFEGAQGWGEIWSNFPPSAANHRSEILQSLVFPSIKDAEFESPRKLADFITGRWQLLANHTGETGAFENIVAGIDIAVWDLLSRKAGLSLASFVLSKAADWCHLSMLVPYAPKEKVRVYASSPDRAQLESRIEEILSNGHRAVKLKVGYCDESDVDVVRRTRRLVGSEFEIMVDSNQIWSVEQALDVIPRLDESCLSFVEEPVPATLPISEWARLNRGVRPDLAGGENIRSLDDLTPHIETGGIRVMQPSITKIGGVTGWLDLASVAVNAGMRLCPHYMGAAPGLAVTLQLLSLFDGAGPMELDANDNPLRTNIGFLDLSVDAGTIKVPKGNGTGLDLEPEQWRDLSE
ncbi:mandelate racemase/muconate lactonizing enzyme family protein [Roseibium sp.]|uniref:mandelate racemase/muconate lactonizing enzyme family protein n=1 Tax=Roseibium sp. TaxID=1936156 RepID=UPI0026234743|nr:mandelate racemase/muconate lactonizing enzyme family protein [Roseibium sp.]